MFYPRRIMKLYQKILIGILTGVIGLPTVTLGGSLTVSLIQGKTLDEAVQILAEQIDSLISRIEVVEVKQSDLEAQQSLLKSQQLKQELWQEKEEACGEYEVLLDSTPRMTASEKYGSITDPLLGVEAFIEYAHEMLEGPRGWSTTSQLYLQTQADLEKAISQREPLKAAKQKCDELVAQYLLAQ
ncbi:MAG: hypothetical protein V1756_00230 [Patescibacteria group bacterium]